MGRWMDLVDQMAGEQDEGYAPPAVKADVQAFAAPGGLLGLWLESIYALDPAAPRGGYSVARWGRMVADCDRFLREYGESAIALGWSTIDIFGVDPARDELGGLIWRLHGGPVIFLGDACATYRLPLSDRTSRFARGYLARLATRFVPIWALERQSEGEDL